MLLQINKPLTKGKIKKAYEKTKALILNENGSAASLKERASWKVESARDLLKNQLQKEKRRKKLQKEVAARSKHPT